MPSGYTADVMDGKIDTLEEFALSCARGFMPFILLRDIDQSLKATRAAIENDSYLETSDYDAKGLVDAERELARIEKLTPQEVSAWNEAEMEERARINLRHEQERLATKARYEAMIEKVEAWQPPTEDHVNFKDFMLKQLRESAVFDCRPWMSEVKPISDEQFLAERIERARRDIEYHAKNIRETAERNASRKAWVTALLDSLESVECPA